MEEIKHRDGKRTVIVIGVVEGAAEPAKVALKRLRTKVKIIDAQLAVVVPDRENSGKFLPYCVTALSSLSYKRDQNRPDPSHIIDALVRQQQISPEIGAKLKGVYSVLKFSVVSEGHQNSWSGAPQIEPRAMTWLSMHTPGDIGVQCMFYGSALRAREILPGLSDLKVFLSASVRLTSRSSRHWHDEFEFSVFPPGRIDEPLESFFAFEGRVSSRVDSGQVTPEDFDELIDTIVKVTEISNGQRDRYLQI